MNRRNVLIIISILAFIMIVGGISYSYFVYNKEVGEVNLTTGDISIDLSGINGNQTLTNVIPVSDYDGINSNSYFDFTVNSTVDTERIYYEVYLLPNSGNTLDTSYLKTYLTDQSNNEIKGITIYNDLGDSEVENGKVIYKGIVEVNNNGTTRTETKNFRLRLWLDENYNEQTSKTFAFDIYLYAKNVDESFYIPYASTMIRNNITNKQNSTSCNPTWTDLDDTVYLSGNNDCVDMNYVWYSGKLWRIVSISSDNTLKLVTEGNMTNIPWGDTIEYDKSIVYQWLNEDFYDTLVNPNGLIKNATWNYSTESTDPPTKPENVENQLTITGMVGLLGRYDYYNGYRNSTSSNNYLNIGYYWHTITPGNTSRVGMVNNEGSFILGVPSNSILSVRPSIYLKPSVEFTGEGTKSSPFKVVGDKKTGQVNDKISTRSVGEYISFNDELFRIVEKYDNKTKIVTAGYLRVSNDIITKKFASTVYYGKSGNTQSDEYLDYYLNNTWYNSLSSTNKNMLVSDTYYLAPIQGTNYKATICSDNDLTGLTTKTCTKYTDANNTFTGKVGMIRLGEIFASQPVIENSPSILWLITKDSSGNSLRVIQPGGYVQSKIPTETSVVRPTITLKDTVKIISGSGTQNDPYVVGL